MQCLLNYFQIKDIVSNFLVHYFANGLILFIDLAFLPVNNLGACK